MLDGMAVASTAKGPARTATVRPTLIGWVWLGVLGCATAPAPAPATTAAAGPSAPAEPAATPAEPAATGDGPLDLDPLARLAPVVHGYTPAVAKALAKEHVAWATDTWLAVTRRGAVRLVPHGPDLGLRDQAPFPGSKRLPVLEDGERPRVIVDDGAIRLLLYVDRQDLRPVLLREAPLRPDPTTALGDSPRRGHAILLPGAWVDVIATEGAMARVSYGEPEPKLRGWIEADALGTTFTKPPPVRGGHDEEGQRRARRAAKLRERPGGKALTTIDEDDSVRILAPAAQQGHQWVEYQPMCERGVRYVGFVQRRDLYTPELGLVTGCGRGGVDIPVGFGEAEGAPRVTLEPGRILLDADSPTVVGCVHAQAEVAELGEGRYAVATIWGPVPVRLALADVRGDCGKHRTVWLR